MTLAALFFVVFVVSVVFFFVEYEKRIFVQGRRRHHHRRLRVVPQIERSCKHPDAVRWQHIVKYVRVLVVDIGTQGLCWCVER